MALSIKSAADIAKKWAEVTPGRVSYYTSGVAGAGTAWEKGATDAAENYKRAVTAGNIGLMFTGGIKRAGAAKYQLMASGKGPDRFSTGVTAGAPYMASGFEPFQQVIASENLPARQPRGSTANMARSAQIAKDLNLKRLALRSAGA